MSGWLWLARLSLFVALFLTLAFLAGLGVSLAGLPIGEGLSWGGVLALVGSALAASWVLTTRVERRPLVTLGLRTGPPGLADLGWGTAAGVAVIGPVILALHLFGWVSWHPTPEPGSPLGTAVALGGLLFGAAFFEELLVRGYPFQVVLRRFGPRAAIASTALVFGLLHLMNPDVGALGLANITLAGVLLGVAYWRTGSLWFATGVHVGWNWVMAASDLAVSGIRDLEMPGFDAAVAGPPIWTGGAFGPEGGLLVTATTLFGILALWRLPPRDESLSAFESRNSRTILDPSIRSREAGG